VKFKVTLKDPDTLQDAIIDAVRDDVSKLEIEADEREAIEERRREKVGDLCAAWFRYGEYLTVEIDTEAKTCVVCEDND